MHDKSLAATLRITIRLCEELHDRDLEYIGLGPGQARVLQAATKVPGLTVAGLSEQLELDKSTVSRALQALVALHYLEAHPDPRDRRGRRYGPTKLGKAMAQEITGIAEEIDEIMQAGLTDEDRQTIRRLLAAVASNLSQEFGHPGRRCAIFPDIHRVPRHPSEGTPP